MQIARHLIEVDIVPCSLIKQQNGRVLEKHIIHKINCFEQIKGIGSRSYITGSKLFKLSVPLILQWNGMKFLLN